MGEPDKSRSELEIEKHGLLTTPSAKRAHGEDRQDHDSGERKGLAVGLSAQSDRMEKAETELKLSLAAVLSLLLALIFLAGKDKVYPAAHQESDCFPSIQSKLLWNFHGQGAANFRPHLQTPCAADLKNLFEAVVCSVCAPCVTK